MKVLIWFGCLFILAVVQTMIRKAGILLGGLPTGLLVGATCWVAGILCKKWDENDGSTSQEEKTTLWEEKKDLLTALCVSGPIAGSSISGEVVYIGKDPQLCQLVFPENTSEVNRIHCMLHTDGKKIELRDMRAETGTYLMDGTKLKPDESVEIKAGDSFYLGTKNNLISVFFGEAKDNPGVKRYKYICTACSHLRTGWYPKCPDCGAVDTIQPYSNK